MTTAPSRIHVLFKTHLDLGFTDDAHAVVDGYLHDYLPKAIALARQLKVEAPADRFVWTVGSWLVHEALDRLQGRARADLELALAEGDIRWHALPFTTHTEYLDAGLVRHGLALSQALDRRFGTRTRAAKMTDVPGHTRALVPLLAEAGVALLHIGVNPASAVPEVPAWSRWRCDGAEVILGYEGSYGGTSQPVEGGDALAFGFTGDNHGPQDAFRVRQFYHQLRQRFPGVPVAATGFDGFTVAALELRQRLPVVDEEIGDTWIHGTGSDPEKTRRFRALARWRAELLRRDPGQAERRELRRFSSCLLLVGEHTWGRDTKRILPDWTGVQLGAWDNAGLRADRAAGLHDHLERSWQEQRAYLDQALDCLAGSPLQAEARRACAWPDEPAGPWQALPTAAPFSASLAGWELDVDGEGALGGLRAPSGEVLADPGHRLGTMRYEVFGAEEYEAFLSAYNPDLPKTRCWAVPDFGKPGLEAVLARGRAFSPRLVGAARRTDGAAVRLELAFPDEASAIFGCPRRCVMVIAACESTLTWDLRWSGKPATRIPEALWLGFQPPLAEPEGLRLVKLGREIDPRRVVAKGNRALHACDEVRWRGTGPQWRLELPDTGLVAPGGPALVRFRQELPDPRDGLALNLFNNTWGTNFPLWYQDDGLVRVGLGSAGAPAGPIARGARQQ